MLQRILLGAILALIPTSLPRAQGAEKPLLREQVDIDLVRRWPIEAWARKGNGACPGLDPEHVLLEEDGTRVDVRHVEAARLKAVHAIVVDVSLSMRRNMRWAQQAVHAYLEGLPEDEAVLLLSFSDDPVLVSPLTTDRQALEQAIDELVVSNETALWDALLAAMDLLVRSIWSSL